MLGTCIAHLYPWCGYGASRTLQSGYRSWHTDSVQRSVMALFAHAGILNAYPQALSSSAFDGTFLFGYLRVGCDVAANRRKECQARSPTRRHRKWVRKMGEEGGV